MLSFARALSICFLITLLPAAAARADVAPEAAQKLYQEVTPSLVAVKYTFTNELNRRELISSGIIVGEDGLVMAPLVLFNTSIPDEQMKDFKIVVPHEDRDPEELDATFLGRDERYNLAWLKAKEPQKWKALKFEEGEVKIGEPILSVGILPKSGGYKSYIMQSTVAASLRGETPQVLAQGGLSAVGSPVFNAAGKAIGLVNYQIGQPALLNDPSNAIAAINNPPKFFTPAKDFLQGLTDHPTPENQIILPWMGVVQMTGVNQDVADFYDLKNQPAVQIGGVIPNMPADKGGLKKGNIIIKLNGQPLERGDEPAEVAQILQRKVTRLKPGETITFSVLTEKDKPAKDVQIKLDPMPKRPNLAKRYYAEDLGFAIREIVFQDTYAQRLPADAKGVVVALIRPQSAAASGGLEMNDVVTELNRAPVTDPTQFEKDYEQFRKDKSKEAVVMVVLREGQTKVIRIEPPQ